MNVGEEAKNTPPCPLITKADGSNLEKIRRWECLVNCIKHQSINFINLVKYY
jgi:hypothetical protein